MSSTVTHNYRTLPAFFLSTNPVKIENNGSSLILEESPQSNNIQEVIEEPSNSRNVDSKTDVNPTIKSEYDLSNVKVEEDSTSEIDVDDTRSIQDFPNPIIPSFSHSEDGNGTPRVSSSDNILVNDVPSSEVVDSQKRLACRYGISCYRENVQHKRDFSHPGDDDYDKNVGCSSITDVNANPKKPACWYGISCFRKNKDHFEKFDHPSTPSGRPRRVTEIQIGFYVYSNDSDELEDFSDSDEYDASFIDDDDDDSDCTITSEEDASEENISGSVDSDTSVGGNKKKKRAKNKKKKFCQQL